MSFNRISLSGLITVSLALACPLGNATSLTPPDGSVQGIVSFDDGTPIAGATVILQNLSTLALFWHSTAADGSFAGTVPDGNYRAAAQLVYTDHTTQLARNFFEGAIVVPGAPNINIFFPQPVATLPGLTGGRGSWTTGSGSDERLNVVAALRADWLNPVFGPSKQAIGARSLILFELWNDTEDPVLGYDNTGPLENNGQVVAAFLKDRVNTKNPALTGATFNLLGHSMGGIYPRAFLARYQDSATPPIGRMVQMGSPNGGSVVLELGKPLWPFPAMNQMATSCMNIFNGITPPPQSLQWGLIGGTKGLLLSPEGLPNDEVVGLWSVNAPRGLYSGTPFNTTSFNVDHTGLHEATSPVVQADFLLDRATDSDFQTSFAAGAPPPQAQAVAFNRTTAATPIVNFWVEDTSAVQLVILRQSESTRLMVKDPLGREISLQDQGMAYGLLLATATLEWPTPGPYTCEADRSLGPAEQDDPIMLVAHYATGPVLSASVNSSGRTRVVTAKLEDGTGAPLSGATVIAELTGPAGTPLDRVLLTSGVADGTYAAALPEPTRPGWFHIKVSALHQTPTGLTFERHAAASYEVSAGSARIGIPLRDTAEDLDHDSLMDWLVVDVELSFDHPGDYIVHGQLGAADGTVLGTASTRLEVATAGVTTAALRYSGTEIRRAEKDPAQLVVVELFDSANGLILEDALRGAPLTRRWSSHQFELPSLPQLRSATPNLGPRGGGSEVLLGGPNLAGGNVRVWFGAQESPSVIVMTSGKLKVTLPALSGSPDPGRGTAIQPATVDVRVRNGNGESILVNGFTYLE